MRRSRRAMKYPSHRGWLVKMLVTFMLLTLIVAGSLAITWVAMKKTIYYCEQFVEQLQAR